MIHPYISNIHNVKFLQLSTSCAVFLRKGRTFSINMDVHLVFITHIRSLTLVQIAVAEVFFFFDKYRTKKIDKNLRKSEQRNICWFEEPICETKVNMNSQNRRLQRHRNPKWTEDEIFIDKMANTCSISFQSNDFMQQISKKKTPSKMNNKWLNILRRLLLSLIYVTYIWFHFGLGGREFHYFCQGCVIPSPPPKQPLFS